MKFFEFNTLVIKNADARPAVVCIAVLVLFEIFVARGGLIWSVDQRSESGQIDVLETKVIGPVSAGEGLWPTVLVLGNSRTRDALSPAALEAAWGLERGGVMNLSMTGGEPFDYRVINERHGELAERAEVVVLAIEDWFFREDPLVSERFRRFSSLEDRLAVWRATGDPDLLVGGLWRTYDARKMIKRAPIEWLQQHKRRLKLTEDGRVTWRSEDPEEGSETFGMTWELDTYFREYKPGRATVDDLSSTIGSIGETGARVVLVRPPLRDAFADARAELAPESEAHFDTIVSELEAAFPGLVVIENERGSELGLGWRAYLDYGHMSRSGARAYSAWFAARLGEAGITIDPEAGTTPGAGPETGAGAGR